MSPDAPEAPSSLEPDFGSMGIYVDGRTANELNELLKRKSASAITSRDLHALSCMHYLDDEPMREAAAHFRLADADVNGGTPRTVLDFGAGYAGDARVLADEYPGVLVTCVEVQRHIHDAAARFTAMLASAHPSRGPPRCLHECLDILDDRADDEEEPVAIPGAPFDHLMSVLVVLHIPRRDRLWRALAAALKPGGTAYVEDYFALRPLTREDLEDLEGPVVCPYLPTKEEYVASLERAGFEDVRWETMNDRWGPFVEARLRRFREDAERNLRVHGEALREELDRFYRTVHALFERGNQGGARITFKKRGEA